ncbi:MAG: hypothetical protein M0P31_07080 [Solirubrobacteraceae bacterium]|nr:hypothetical protein [Solirubrobacteraceae bacterium]
MRLRLVLASLAVAVVLVGVAPTARPLSGPSTAVAASSNQQGGSTDDARRSSSKGKQSSTSTLRRSTTPPKGLQDMAMSLSDDPRVRDDFWVAVERARVTRIRILVNWYGSAVRPDPVVLDRVRRAMREGLDHGARTIVGIYAPIANPTNGDIKVTSRLVSRFRRFTKALAKGVEDLRPYAYLTWNEPNYWTMWPAKHPRRWVTMSNAGYRGFKAGDRRTQVLVGETAPYSRSRKGQDPGLFMRRALCLTSGYRSRTPSRSCRKRLLGDGIGIHAHDFVHNPRYRRRPADAWTIGNLAKVRRQLGRMADAGRISRKASRNLHITEFAYRSRGSSRTGDRRQATWLRRAWKEAERHGVRSFFWYQLRDPGAEHTWASGLQSETGRPVRRVWRTFRYLR